ncbi:hypothetical protein HmCmsJML033_02747 [Escherichia coli]|nr:hypothetical protein HmCmsJML033_02747 [Escherichia coli]
MIQPIPVNPAEDAENEPDNEWYVRTLWGRRACDC